MLIYAFCRRLSRVKFTHILSSNPPVCRNWGGANKTCGKCLAILVFLHLAPPPVFVVVVGHFLLLSEVYRAKQARNIHIVTYKRAAASSSAPSNYYLPKLKKRVPEPRKEAPFGRNFWGRGGALYSSIKNVWLQLKFKKVLLWTGQLCIYHIPKVHRLRPLLLLSNFRTDFWALILVQFWH